MWKAIIPSFRAGNLVTCNFSSLFTNLSPLSLSSYSCLSTMTCFRTVPEVKPKSCSFDTAVCVCHIVTVFPHPPHSVVKALEEEEGQIMKYRKAGKEEAAKRQQPNRNAKNYGEVTEREAQTRNYTWWLSTINK